MATYNSTNRPTRLALEDIVVFTTPDGTDLRYRVRRDHLALPGLRNDTVFNHLPGGQTKKEFCTEHYGYAATNGVWPVFAFDDFAAATRAVNALFDLLSGKTAVKTPGDHGIPANLLVILHGATEIARSLVEAHKTVKVSPRMQSIKEVVRTSSFGDDEAVMSLMAIVTDEDLTRTPSVKSNLYTQCPLGTILVLTKEVQGVAAGEIGIRWSPTTYSLRVHGLRDVHVGEGLEDGTFRPATPDEVISYVERDRHYFRADGAFLGKIRDFYSPTSMAVPSK